MRPDSLILLLLWVSLNVSDISGLPGSSVSGPEITTIHSGYPFTGKWKGQAPAHLRYRSALSMQGQPLRVRFCDLLRRPELYDQRLISVAAIEIKQIAPIVDGGDSYLYSPQCDNPKSYLLLEADSAYERNSVALKKAARIISRARKQKHEQARFSVLLTGRFIVAKGTGGFGHLDWARFKLTITRMESLKEVPEKTPWPLTFRRSQRHGR